MGARIAVVIPSYKATLTINEKISLTQAKQILGKHDIFFVLPNSVEIDYGCMEITEIRYPDEFFSSIRAYSRFMLTSKIYSSFKSYDYILIYQLDTFVFADRLDEFCDLGFDYIGAPWIDGIYFKKNEKEKMWYVGNGGLSLRRVEAFLRWIKKGDFEQYAEYLNEDLLIAVYGAPILKIAPMSVALSFSFEMNCEQCTKMAKGELPLGCHAWAKYDLDFWKPFIEKYGYFVEETGKKKSDSAEWQKKINEFCNMPLEGTLQRVLPSTYQTNEDGGIFIWGTGQWGITLLQKLIENKILVVGFIDNDKDRCGKSILTYEIFHSSLLIHDKRPIIVAIKNNPRQVEKQLQEYGYKKQIDYILMQYMIDELMQIKFQQEK